MFNVTFEGQARAEPVAPRRSAAASAAPGRVHLRTRDGRWKGSENGFFIGACQSLLLKQGSPLRRRVARLQHHHARGRGGFLPDAISVSRPSGLIGDRFNEDVHCQPSEVSPEKQAPLRSGWDGASLGSLWGSQGDIE